MRQPRKLNLEITRIYESVCRNHFIPARQFNDSMKEETKNRVPDEGRERSCWSNAIHWGITRKLLKCGALHIPRFCCCCREKDWATSYQAALASCLHLSQVYRDSASWLFSLRTAIVGFSELVVYSLKNVPKEVLWTYIRVGFSAAVSSCTALHCSQWSIVSRNEHLVWGVSLNWRLNCSDIGSFISSQS